MTTTTTTLEETKPKIPNYDLVLENLELVNRIVNETIARMPPHVEKDDLYSAGIIGLIQASASYDPTKGIPFTGFAPKRIKGAIMDEMRAKDPVPRYWRTIQTEYLQTQLNLTNTLTHVPKSKEIAEHLGYPEETIHTMRTIVQRDNQISLENLANSEDRDTLTNRINTIVTGEPQPNPEEQLMEQTEIEILHHAIKNLPDRHREILTRLYYDNEPGNHIAETLNITESRVSQIRAEALGMLHDGITMLTDLPTKNPVIGISTKALYLRKLAGLTPKPTDRKI